MNHYVNYRKWRLSRLNPIPNTRGAGMDNYTLHPDERIDTFHEPTSTLPTRTKDEIAQNPESVGPSVGIYAPPEEQRTLIPHINQLLGNLRYVAPEVGHLPRLSVHITDSLNSMGEYGPGIHRLGSYPERTIQTAALGLPLTRDSINDTMSKYAGTLFLDLLHRHKGNITKWPALDELSDIDFKPSTDNIPEDHIHRPEQIDGFDTKDRPLGNYAPLIAHRVSELYKSFLSQPESKETSKDFAEFMSKQQSNIPHEQLLNDLISQIVDGMHLKQSPDSDKIAYKGKI